jgi:multidrug efflux pump subunit AcrA (membrane-fusion protein)
MMLQRNKVAAGVVVAVALGLVGYGIWGRKHQLAALERVAVEQSVPSVEIITPSPGPAARPLVLPGTVRACTRRRYSRKSPDMFGVGTRTTAPR